VFGLDGLRDNHLPKSFDWKQITTVNPVSKGTFLKNRLTIAAVSKQ